MERIIYKFKKGDLLKLINNECMGAKIGALAICRGYYDGFVQIEWIRNELCSRQGDGGYYQTHFDFADTTDRMRMKDIKPYGIVKFLEIK